MQIKQRIIFRHATDTALISILEKCNLKLQYTLTAYQLQLINSWNVGTYSQHTSAQENKPDLTGNTARSALSHTHTHRA